MVRLALAAALLASCSGPPPLCHDGTPGSPFYLSLAEGWALQSERATEGSAPEIATPGYATLNWHHPISIPSTVVAALVSDATLADPYVGLNMRTLPGGTDYDIGEMFSTVPMSPDNPFSSPWWYRTEFAKPASGGRRVWLRLGGVNYRAEVWLNGRQLASDSQVAGTFRTFEFDVTELLTDCSPNVLAVKVSAPGVENLAWNWVDWAPSPPDKNMGLWQPVSLFSTGAVRLRSPHVMTRLDLPSPAPAHLSVTVEATNATSARVSTQIAGRILPGPIDFSEEVTLEAGETRTLRFEPQRFPQLDVAQPQLWWPLGLGAQPLYTLTLSSLVAGALSDQATTRFGIREIGSELTEQKARLFRVNGRPVLIRGAAWSPDLLLRPNSARVDDELAYVKEMNLNAIRLEGKLGDDHLLDRCDELGILVMAGWCCCDHWEMQGKWSSADRTIAVESLRDQIRRLRNHPSVLVWLNGSDKAPPPEIDQAYLDVLQSLEWQLPTLASASATDTPELGTAGVKMTGPYRWVPPNYWGLDYLRGGAFGFNTETSPGAAVPPLESLKKFLPKEDLWPVDQAWIFHTGAAREAQKLEEFSAALAGRYGAATTIEDFALKAQLAAYEGERAMFEAYGRNKYFATGVIQWMLNNPWPGLIWHLYDWYLKPGGGYFGAKRALEPLHVQYGYEDGAVVVVNSTPQPFSSLQVRAAMLDLNAHERWSGTKMLDVADDGVAVAMSLPDPASVTDLGNTYLVLLTLNDSKGALKSRNYYWLSQIPDVLDDDPEHSTNYSTPTISYADLTELANLPLVQVMLSATRRSEGADEVVQVTLNNPTPAIAFFVRAEIARGMEGDEVVPIRWDDNYVLLLPGETRKLNARYRAADRQGAIPVARLSGWNVATVNVPLP